MEHYSFECQNGDDAPKGLERDVHQGENLSGSKDIDVCVREPSRLLQYPAGSTGGSREHFSWASPTSRIDVHSQMWRDRLPFRLIVQAIEVWVDNEPHISAVAIDYSCGYRVGILANKLTRDIMQALHSGFEPLRQRFGDHQPAVYVLGDKERKADIFTDDTSYIIQRSK